MNEDESELVMAMPRRELYTVRGFVKDIAVGVISCLADESWFGLPDHIRAEVDAKQVRIGVIIRHDDKVLIEQEEGVAVFVVPVTDSATRLGPGLRALRELARIAGESLVKVDCHNVEMRGYFNDDSNPDLRPYLVVIYEVSCREGAVLDDGYGWLDLMDVGTEPLDPLSSQVLSELYE